MSNLTITSAVALAATSLPTSGYVALGYSGVDNFVWSNPRQCVVPLSANALSSAATLMAVCGEKWCRTNHPKVNDKGTVTGFIIQDVAGEIITACAEAGIYNADANRGAGVWSSPLGLVVNSGSLWSPTIKEPLSRAGFAGNVYPRSRTIGIEPGTAIATPADMAELDEMLEAYIWGHQSDPMLLSGWLIVAVLAGAILRRPHICLTGPMSAGKTTLRDIFGAFVGGMGVFGDAKSTPAGIYQTMRADAGPVLLDEGEPEAGGGNVARLVRMARSTYSDDSSDGILQGTSSGNAKSFAMKLTFLLSAIAPPALEAADASRWIITEIKSVKKEAQLNPSRLITEYGYAAKQGLKIKALIVSRYDVFVESLAIIRAAIMSGAAKGRQADTVGTLCAGYWILHHDTAPTTAEALALVAGLDTATHAEAHSSSDEQDCLAAILRAVIRDGQEALTVAEAIDRVNSEGSKSRWASVLGHAGLKVVGGRLQVAISETHVGVKALLKGTKFEHGGWGRILKRLPDAENNRPSYIAGLTQKIVSVVYPTREVAGAGEVVDLFEGTVRKLG